MKTEETFIYNGYFVDLSKASASYLKTLKQEIIHTKTKSTNSRSNITENYKYYNGVVVKSNTRTK